MGPPPRSSNTTLVNLATFILAVAALYFGKPVLVPLAMATLLAFLLSPVTNALVRTGMRQPLAVLLVVALMFSILSAMVWGFGRQFSALAYQLPDYRQNLQAKIADLRTAATGLTFQRMRQTWRDLKGELKKSSPSPGRSAVEEAAGTNAPPAELEPVPVVVKGQDHTEVWWNIPTALGPLAEVVATAFLVFVLLVFMLLRKRELRNRIILLFGYSRVPATTRALDEAADRISRYLLMQTIVNSIYGSAVGIAVYFIGLPYALMWGFLAGLLRFIPYVGTWIGAVLPIALSLAVFPGWLPPLLILGVIIVLELINNSFMEPLLYGQTAGVSEVALLVAVAFWTWVWGSIGLVLATPLTVCLVVFGKYVPGLSFLPLLLGDEAVMEPPLEFYQRLLAMDETEAREIVVKYARDHELIDIYEDLLLPALLNAKRDYLSEKLSEDHLDFIISTTGQLISRIAADARSKGAQPVADNAPEILAIPVEDTLDELAMSMLALVLPSSVSMRIISSEALSGEALQEIEQRTPAVVCIGALSPGGLRESRYLAKRLQKDCPELPRVLARWGLRSEKRVRELLRATNASAVVTDLKQARNHLVQLAQIGSSIMSPRGTEDADLRHN